MVTAFPVSCALHNISQLYKSQFSLGIFGGGTFWCSLETFFSLRAIGAHAGVFLMLSLLLKALPACSLLAVPCALVHHQSSDPGTAAVHPRTLSISVLLLLFCRVGFNFGCQRSKTDEKAGVSWSTQRLAPASIRVLTFPPSFFIEISYRKCVLLPHLSPFGGLFWPHKVCCPLSLPPRWVCMPWHSPLPGAHQGHHPRRTPSAVVSCCWAWTVSGVSQEGPYERDCPPIDTKLFFCIARCIVFCLV